VLSFASVLSEAPQGRQLARDARASPLSPTIEKRKLSNGLAVWIVEHHEVPAVYMSLLVPSGSGDDPQGQEGIAALTAAMLAEGAGSLSGRQLADELGGLKSNLLASANLDSTTVQMYVPAARLAEALPLMADVVGRPTFPDEALERVRQERLAMFQRGREDPDTITSLAFLRVIYGSSHRYSRPLVGTPETIKSFTRGDLSAFHDAVYRPDNSTLIVVGDVVPSTLLPLLERHFGSWQHSGAKPALPKPPVAPQNVRPRLTLVDMPNAPQSRIRFGGVGPVRSSPDFFPVQVMNTVLASRLQARMRDYAGSVGSGFDMRRSTGSFVAWAAVPTDRTADSVADFVKEFSQILTTVPPDELERAKASIALGLPTPETTGRMSSRLQLLESQCLYELPDDYYSNYETAIRAVSGADVLRVAQKYVDRGGLATLIVGDRVAIAPSLGALNLGPITQVTIAEVFAPPR
jgi:zinc protease